MEQYEVILSRLGYKHIVTRRQIGLMILETEGHDCQHRFQVIAEAIDTMKGDETETYQGDKIRRVK